VDSSSTLQCRQTLPTAQPFGGAVLHTGSDCSRAKLLRTFSHCSLIALQRTRGFACAYPRRAGGRAGWQYLWTTTLRRASSRTQRDGDRCGRWVHLGPFLKTSLRLASNVLNDGLVGTFSRRCRLKPLWTHLFPGFHPTATPFPIHFADCYPPRTKHARTLATNVSLTATTYHCFAPSCWATACAMSPSPATVLTPTISCDAVSFPGPANTTRTTHPLPALAHALPAVYSQRRTLRICCLAAGGCLNDSVMCSDTPTYFSVCYTWVAVHGISPAAALRDCLVPFVPMDLNIRADVVTLSPDTIAAAGDKPPPPSPTAFAYYATPFTADCLPYAFVVGGGQAVSVARATPQHI